MPQAELYDGTILEFEDGTPDDVIERVARQQTEQLRTAEARKPLPAGVKPSTAGGGRGALLPDTSEREAATAPPAPQQLMSPEEAQPGGQSPAAAAEPPPPQVQPPWRIGGRGGAPTKAPPTPDQRLATMLETPTRAAPYSARELEEGTIAPQRLEQTDQERAARARGTPEVKPLTGRQEFAADVRDVIGDNPVARGAAAGFSGLARAGVGATRLAADLVGAESVADFAAATSRTTEAVGGGMSQGLGDMEKLVHNVTSSIVQSAPAIAMGTVGGPAMRTLFAQSALSEYNTGRDSGFGVIESATRGGIMAGADVLGERFGFPEQIRLLKGVVRDLPADEMTKTFVELIKKEVPGEQLTTALQFLADKAGPAAQNPDATLEDYFNQAGEALKTTIGQTAVLGGGPAALATGKEALRGADAAVARSGLTQAERAMIDRWGANAYAIANARGFVVNPPLKSDPATVQRKKTTAMFDNLAAQYGIPPGAVSRAKAAADGLPLDQLGPFYQRFVQALGKRNLVAQPVEPHAVEVLGTGPIVLPEERQAETPQAAGETKAGVAETKAGVGETSAGLDDDYSGLSEPAEVPPAQRGRAAQPGPPAVPVVTPGTVDEQAHEAAASPTNDRPEPTGPQALAGNYKKGHPVVAGLDISIENPQGSVRQDKQNDPPKWRTTMQHHYGYFRGTKGIDGDAVDTFVKPGTAEEFSGTVFVVDQVDPKTGKPDEHKVMLGFDSLQEARAAYQANYPAGWKGLGAISAVPMNEFKAWLADPAKTSKPYQTPYDGPTMAEIDALKDVKTVDIMREAVEAVGEAEFQRQAEQRLEENRKPGGAGFTESMIIEGTARGIVALSRRAKAARKEPSAPQPDVPAAATVVAATPAGGRDQPGGSGRDLGRVPDVAQRVGGRAEAPAAGPGTNGAVADAGEQPQAVGGPRVVGRAGRTPKQAKPIEARENADGTLTPWFEGRELLDFESGEPVKVPAGASDRQVLDAVRAAGSLSKRMQFFGEAAGGKAPKAEKPKAPARAPAPETPAPAADAIAPVPPVEQQPAPQEPAAPAELTDDEAFAQDYAAFDGLTVEQPVLVADTGATATLRMDAAKALRLLDARERALKALKDCLEKGAR